MAAPEPLDHPAVGSQDWRDLLFLHWRVSAEAVQRSLPQGLVVDTFGGDAWVGIVPFAMARVRPRFLPPVPWLSWFLELNVRTYVRHADGTPGGWFYSLDCNQPIAVEIAQHLFHLPYRHAQMRVHRDAGRLQYWCRRRGQTAPPWHFDWQTHSAGVPALHGTLEHFLVERYVLYAADTQRQLYRGYVSHVPYRIHEPVLRAYDTAPAALAGFPLDGAPLSVLAAAPVTVKIHSLRKISTP